MARNMASWCTGRRVQRAERVDPELLSANAAASLAGALLGAARRRGKYLCQPVDADKLLILHFRMTGKVVLEDRPRPHVRLRLVLDDGGHVAFVDTRRLGQAWLIDVADTDAFFASRKLGPEPWPMTRDAAWWRTRLMGLRGAVKPALMRQDRIAGLGNIMASELCFRMGRDPRVPVPKLTDADYAALALGAPALIAHVLAEEAGAEIAYINEGRTAPNPFSVYAREGETCTRCGGTIQRFTQSGRSTFFCPGCQR